MQRQRWKNHRSYAEVVSTPARFAVGDLVHTVDGGEIGTVAYVRRDGMINITWPSGTREWRHQDHLCGPIFQ